MPVLNVMFFDIGGTLGDVEPAAMKLSPYPDTVAILRGARALGFRLGVLTNVFEDTDRERVRAMLVDAGIADYFDEDALITSTEAGCLKPNVEIFMFAADAVRTPVQRCIYVDVNPYLVAGAVAAGMQGVLSAAGPARR